jgi:hypothetical protein
MLTRDSLSGVRVELTRRVRARTLRIFSAVTRQKGPLEELPCAFLREFCAG